MMYGVQATVTVHVDDIKISCSDRRGVDDVLNELRRVYKRMNVNEGPKFDYLGMDVDFSDKGKVRVSMVPMVEEAISMYDVTGSATTPAANYLFKVSDDAEKLDESRRAKFHSTTQLLLYLAKRARPDILPAVSFLTTRVQKATVEDENKLLRVLKYLNGTKHLCLVLRGNKGMVVTSYIDASFATHPDMKGHTGGVIFAGKGAVFSKSSKQKIVTKSSTESELVGISDGLSQVLWTRNFLNAQGYKQGPATIYQDNKSTIILAENGRTSSQRTRHISIKYFFVKDRIQSGDIKIEYKATEEMIADLFTKPLQGKLFSKFRCAVMNCCDDDGSIAGVCSGK
jgi:hypothetical protein